jgi:hypothetical protein
MGKTGTPFEHAALEADIKRLAQEIQETRGINPENVKEAVREKLHDRFYAPNQNANQATTTANSSGDTASSVLPGYLQSAPADIKYHVEKLIDFAWHEGIFKAIKKAREDDPLILDAFHDALTDKVYDALKTRGHVK